MRIVASLALTLGLGLVWSGQAARSSDQLDHRGGEGDWPLFCSISGSADYDAFLLRTDARSPSGYALYFYDDGVVQSSVYPSVEETEDGQFLQVYGVETFGLFGRRDRHLLAYVAKADGHPSEAGMKTTLRDVSPTFYSTDLKPSTCGQP